MSKKNYTTIFIDRLGHELNADKDGSAIVVCDRMHGKGNNFTGIKVYPPLSDTFTEAQAKATLAIIKRISAAQFYADENRGASAAEVVAVQEGQKDETGKYIAVYVGDNCKLNRRGDVIDDKGYKADVFKKIESTFDDFMKKHTKKSDSSGTGKKSDSSGTGKKSDSSDTGKKSDSSDTDKKSDSSDTGKKSDSSDTDKKPGTHKRFTSDEAIALIDAMWEE